MPAPPQKRPTISPLLKWHTEMVRHISTQLLALLQQQKLSQALLPRLVEAIFIDQTRSPWPASLLSKEKKEAWRETMLRSAKLLLFSKDAAAIKEFASQISGQVLRELSAAQLSESLVSRDLARNTKIELMIRQEFYANASAEDTVSRSVQRYFREDAQARRHKTELRLQENDPLVEVLGLPHIGRTLLPHEDIRVHMARFLQTKKVALATPQLNEGLGKRFAENCKAIGFCDRHKTIFVFETRSASAAHELSFEKAIYIEKLRQMPGFEKLRDIQFRPKARGQG